MAKDTDPKLAKEMEERLKQLEKAEPKMRAIDKEVANYCKTLVALSKRVRG